MPNALRDLRLLLWKPQMTGRPIFPVNPSHFQPIAIKPLAFAHHFAISAHNHSIVFLVANSLRSVDARVRVPELKSRP